MRINSVARAGVGALAVTALLGLGSLDRPDDPAYHLSCPSSVREVEPDNNSRQVDFRTPRQQVAERLAGDAAYTRANMTGRLDDHRLPDGTVEVLARGRRHEPIAVYRFAPVGQRWAFQYLAQCGAWLRIATELAQDPARRLVCPGFLVIGNIDYGESRGPADHETPQDKVRRYVDWPGSEGYVHRRGVEPMETRYLYAAVVIARDAYRRPIGIYQLDWTPGGWQLTTTYECSIDSPADGRPT